MGIAFDPSKHQSPLIVHPNTVVATMLGFAKYVMFIDFCTPRLPRRDYHEDTNIGYQMGQYRSCQSSADKPEVAESNTERRREKNARGAVWNRCRCKVD